MSNYGANLPPGAYQNNASQGYNAQQQPQQQSQPQQPQQGYQKPTTSNYGQPSQSHKSGGTFGQMMNQAVTTGKPMLNKLGKTISSKLGSKPATGPPQHLQSYHNYQQHQNPQSQTQNQPQAQHQTPPQGYQQQQQQTQSFSPQAQQQQWQQPSQSPAPQPPQQPPPNAYTPTQNSPYSQSTYATPASGHSNQNNYFQQQSAPPPPPPNAPPPNPQEPPTSQYAPNAPSYTPSEFGNIQHGQGQNQFGQPSSGQPQSQTQQQQGAHGGQPQGQFQLGQSGSYLEQQTGVIGGAQAPGYNQTQHQGYAQHVQAQYATNASPVSPDQSTQQVYQSQWGYPPEKQGLPSPPLQQQPQYQQYQPQPQQQQQQQQQQQPQQQQYHHVPNGPYQQEQQQHWQPTSPLTHPAQPPSPIPSAPVSPPPPSNVQPQIPPNKPTPSPSPAPTSQHVVPQASPTEFIAELPADMGNLSLGEGSPGQSSARPASQYQAYQPGSQGESLAKGFSVPRRAVSLSSMPLADPWRFADPITETPTREFYILADLLFDALDRKFDPPNTGLLEGPKILKSWIELTEEAQRLWSYNGYTALAHMWSLQGIPHLMVPVQPDLAPTWNFDQTAHAQDLKVIAQPPTPASTYATYIPALNRAGWYKFFFLEIMHGPEDIGKLLPALCADTYKPGVLNHPDLNKRDRSDIPGLQARAAEIQTTAIKRVCDEAKTAMMLDPNVSLSSTTSTATPGSATGSGSLQPGSAEDVAVRMHQIQMERQFNDMAVKTVLGGGVTFGPMGGGGGGYGSLV